MTKSKKEQSTQTVQIRIGQKTPENLRNWLNNQTNANDSAKRVMEHFIRLYGKQDIDNDEVQVKMARDLLHAKGEYVLPVKKIEQEGSTQEMAASIEPIKEQLEIFAAVTKKSETEVKEKPKKHVVANRNISGM